jgi:hypothetical protein
MGLSVDTVGATGGSDATEQPVPVRANNPRSAATADVCIVFSNAIGVGTSTRRW